MQGMVPAAVRAALALLLVTSIAAGVAAAGVADPSLPGRFPVGVATLVLPAPTLGRTFVAEVWYPAAHAGRDAPLRRGRFPLVVVVHGNCGFRTNYEYLTAALAAHGFTVAAPDMPGFVKAACDAGHDDAGEVAAAPAEIGFLSSTFRRTDGPAAAFAPAVRRAKTGLVGHSLGGLAVVLAAVASPSYPAVVALAPAAGAPNGAALAAAPGPRRAVLAIGGSADATVPFDALTVPFFAALARPAFLVRIAGGTHSGFTDVDDRLAPAALARQQLLVRRYAVAFLERWLAGRRRFARFLTPGDAAGQGADVTLARK